ncbi:hypothetical protein ABZ260_50225, partial [Streptosporangium sp. NPDC006013]
ADRAEFQDRSVRLLDVSLPVEQRNAAQREDDPAAIARWAAVGPQESRIGGAAVRVLPNLSGLNAHWTLDGIVEEMRRLRESLA